MKNPIEYYSFSKDDVVNGFVVQAKTTYSYALETLYPLMDSLDIQRDVVTDVSLYKRLEEDILLGCVMPPITIALLTNESRLDTAENIYSYIQNNIHSSFILDGIQRLSTLGRASKRENFDPERALYLNFILAPSRDRLLYRMITLNNGQRPMSTRHQIDILADTFFDFSDIDLELIPEKAKMRVNAPKFFKKSDFIQGYIAYLSKSTNIDNEKIIQEKMDQLIASKIIEERIGDSDFVDVITLIKKFEASNVLTKWIRVPNNFIGFCAGIGKSLIDLANVEIEEIEVYIDKFEQAFKSINVSKVKVGKVRKICVKNAIQDYKDLKDLEEFDFLTQLAEWI